MNDYLEESKNKVIAFLEKQKNMQEVIAKQDIIDNMSFRFYKNYFRYEMDEEYALRAAVSVVLKEENIEIQDFEYWIP